MKPIKKEYLEELHLFVCENIISSMKAVLKKVWYNVDEYDINVSFQEEKKVELEKILNKIKQEWYLEWKFYI